MRRFGTPAASSTFGNLASTCDSSSGVPVAEGKTRSRSAEPGNWRRRSVSASWVVSTSTAIAGNGRSRRHRHPEALVAVAIDRARQRANLLGREGLHLSLRNARRFDGISHIASDHAPAQRVRERPVNHHVKVVDRLRRETLVELLCVQLGPGRDGLRQLRRVRYRDAGANRRANRGVRFLPGLESTHVPACAKVAAGGQWAHSA